MNPKQVDDFELLTGQIAGMYEEMETLVKKSPSDAVNKFKLGLVNSLLQRANELLGTDRRPFPDFEVFDEAAIPSNSDVLVVLSQYLSCLEKLRSENITRNSRHEWYWQVNGKMSEIPTSPPRKLAR